MNTIKKETIIKKLMENTLSDIKQEIAEMEMGDKNAYFLKEILQLGFKGYDNMSDDELEDEYNLIFQTDIQIK